MLKLKQCSKCLQSLKINCFYLRKTGERAGQYYEKCKSCMKKRGVEYYHKNHDRQLYLANKRRKLAYKIKRDLIIKMKNKPCADCNKKYPFYVMDFDHKNWKDKKHNVSYMFTRNWSLDKIRSEIIKCEVLCSNCHRIRTYKLFHNGDS